MFLVSPNKGGYNGDVNTAFKQGMDDEFKRQIGLYNFALQADAANNAENQRNVERIAKNYGFQNQMSQGARNEALNFIKGSNDIAQSAYNFDVNAAKLNYLTPNIDQIGQSQANTTMNTQAAAETNSATNNAKATNDYANVDLLNNEVVAKANAGTAQANMQATDWNFNQSELELRQNKIRDLRTNGLSQAKEALVNQRLARMKAVMDSEGKPFDENTARQQILADPQTDIIAQQAVDTQIANELQALQEFKNAKLALDREKIEQSNARSTKQQTEFAKKIKWQSQNLEGRLENLVAGYTNLGNGFYDNGTELIKVNGNKYQRLIYNADTPREQVLAYYNLVANPTTTSSGSTRPSEQY